MTKISYMGENYLATQIPTPNGTLLLYAEVSLADKMEEYDDLCCDLDNEIIFYPTREELIELDKIKNNWEAVKRFCEENDIFY